jgi:predicted SAM-dependent methyltransferase
MLASPLKLNLGGGLTAVPGWINIDAGWYAWLKRVPAPMLRMIYARSAWKDQVEFNEYRRILRAGKFIHRDLQRGIPFPDNTVDYIFSSHLLDCLPRTDGARVLAEAFRVLRPGGMVRLAVSDLEITIALLVAGDRETARARLFPPTVSRVNLRYFMYDFETLSAALSEAGFVDIERRSFQRGEVPDTELLDSRPDDSLFIEARKR